MGVQEYQYSILAAIFDPKMGEEALHAAQTKLYEENFDPQERSLYQAALTYYNQTNGVLNEDTLLDLLKGSGATPEKQAQYMDLYRDICKEPVDISKLRYSIARLQEARETEGLAEVLTDTMKALSGSVEIDGKRYKGLADAQKVLESGLVTLRGRIVSDTPEGDARAETHLAWEQYQLMKERPEDFIGIQTGLSVIDDVTFGAQKGELWIVAAFTGEGKSIALMNFVWHAVVKQGKNVFVATAEMPKAQWRARLYNRHTQDPALGIGGLRANDIKRATLTPDMEQAYLYALNDFNTNEDYGSCYILQLPHEATLEYLRAKMNQYQARQNIDLLVIDYLSLMAAPRLRVSQREELDDLLKHAKQLALTFNNGIGVPLMTAHQVNRSSWDLAKKSGRYDLNAFAGTSEAEKSSDIAFWILSDDEQPDVLKAGFLKVRDGEVIPEFELRKQFSHMLIEDGSLAVSLDPGVLDIETNLSDLDELIG